MKKNALSGLILLFFLSCKKEQEPLPSSSFFPAADAIQNEWAVPLDQIMEGHVGKDGIQSIDEPLIAEADSAGTLISDEDVVFGVWTDSLARAYPQKMLNYHEVINDHFAGEDISVTYSVLTGSCIVFKYGADLGVSGLIYNSNTVFYDKESDELWSQLLMKCIHGAKKGMQMETVPVIQTSWGEWKKWFPQTDVVVYSEKANPDYDEYPYTNYLTTDSLIYPLSDTLQGFPLKEQVLAVLGNTESKVMRFQDFGSAANYLTFQLDGKDRVVFGSVDQKLMLAFNAISENGDFIQVDEILLGQGNMLFKDIFGTVWDIRGQAISGPAKGDRLTMPSQVRAYAFALNAFYPELFEI